MTRRSTPQSDTAVRSSGWHFGKQPDALTLYSPLPRAGLAHAAQGNSQRKWRLTAGESIRAVCPPEIAATPLRADTECGGGRPRSLKTL